MQTFRYLPPVEAIAEVVEHIYDETRAAYHAYDPNEVPFGHVFESVHEVALWLWPCDPNVAAGLDHAHEQLSLF